MGSETQSLLASRAGYSREHPLCGLCPLAVSGQVGAALGGGQGLGHSTSLVAAPMLCGHHRAPGAHWACLWHMGVLWPGHKAHSLELAGIFGV